MTEIIDIHTHVGEDTFFRNKEPSTSRTMKQTVQELQERLNEYSISHAVIMPFPMPLAYEHSDDFWYHKENEQLSDFSDPRFLFFPAINPSDEKSVNYAFSLVNAKRLRGIKIHTRSCGIDLEEIDKSVFEKASQNKIPLLFHTGNGKENELISREIYTDLPNLLELTKKYPETKFILAHLGRLDSSLERALERTNVFFDTSGLSILKYRKEMFLSRNPHPILAGLTPEKVISYLVENGHEDKLLWGSDEPCGSSYGDELDTVLKSEISDEAKEKILGLNAKNLLGLIE